MQYQQPRDRPLADGPDRKFEGPYVVSHGVHRGILHKGFQTSGDACFREGYGSPTKMRSAGQRRQRNA
jgi:hypothetical protein